MTLTACKGDTNINAGGGTTGTATGNATGGAGGGTTTATGAGGAGGAPAGPMTPEEAEAALAGSWRSTDLGQLYAVVVSLDQTMSFGPDRGHTAQATTVYAPDAPLYADCTETASANGHFAVAGAPGKLLLTFQYDSGTYSRSGCASAADDGQNVPYSPAELSSSSNTGGEIVISNGAFTLTNSIQGHAATWTFVKQP